MAQNQKIENAFNFQKRYSSKCIYIEIVNNNDAVVQFKYFSSIFDPFPDISSRFSAKLFKAHQKEKSNLWGGALSGGEITKITSEFRYLPGVSN